MRIGTAKNRANEEGFVLLTGAFIFLPILLTAFIFLLYGMANVTKAKAQYLSLNLVHAGAFSNEFDTTESLQAMAAFADASGFPSSVSAVNNTPQEFPGFGQLLFVHNTDTVGNHSIDTFVRLESTPISNVVAYLGSVGTTAFSGSAPDELYISVSIDNSKRLINDHKINDILCAFDVSDCQTYSAVWNSPTVPGSNGMDPPPGGPWGREVWPAPGVRAYMPYMTQPPGPSLRSWKQLGTDYPPIPWSNPSCTLNGENWCGGLPANHRSAHDNRVTDLFMSYKKIAALLVGLVAQITPTFDVSLLAAPFTKGVQNNWNILAVGQDDSGGTNMSGDPVTNPLDYQTVTNNNYTAGQFQTEFYLTSNNHYVFVNKGNEPIWRYDMDVRSNLQRQVGPPFAIADVASGDSRDKLNPRNVWTESVNLMPDNPYQALLYNTGWRKMATYMTAYENMAKTIPVTFSATDIADFFRPPFPIFANPPVVQVTSNPDDYSYPPKDAFPWDPMGRNSVTAKIEGHVFGWGYHYDGVPRPRFTSTGLAHPAVLPPELEHAFVYVCPRPDVPLNLLNYNGGVRSDMNYPLEVAALGSPTAGTPGAALCRIAQFCRSQYGYPDQDLDCDDSDGNGDVNPAFKYLFFDANRPSGTVPAAPDSDDYSPRCPRNTNAAAAPDENYEVRCFSKVGGTAVLTEEYAPVCIGGKFYCYKTQPNPGMSRHVGCYDRYSGNFVGVVPTPPNQIPTDPFYTLANGVQPICDPGYGLPLGSVNPPVHYNTDPGIPGNSAGVTIRHNLSTDTAPHYIGSLSTPNSPPTILFNSLMYFLMDISIRVGGTWTVDAIDYARIRSQNFKPGKRVMLLLTDGVPQASFEDGTVLYDDATYVTGNNSHLKTAMNLFTDPNNHDGMSFTWLLGQANGIEELRTWMAAWLTEYPGHPRWPERNEIYTTFVNNGGDPTPIGSETCTSSGGPVACSAAMDAWNPKGYNTGEYNAVVDDFSARKSFMCTMGDAAQMCNTDQRHLVETSVSATASGANVSTTSFLGGLRLVVSLLKRQVSLVH